MRISKLFLLPLTISLPLFAAEAPPHWAPSTVAVVTDYCSKDPAAIRAVNRYCWANRCGSEQYAEINKFCADLAMEESVAGTNLPEPVPTPPQNQPVQPEQPDSEPVSQPAGQYSNADIQLVSRYCKGNQSAFSTLQARCAAGKCTPRIMKDIKSHCASMGAPVDTGLLLADNSSPVESSPPAAIEPPVEPSPPAVIEPPADPAPPQNTVDNDTSHPNYSAEETIVLTSYCKGDGNAESTVIDYCRSNGCDTTVLNGVENFCRSLGNNPDVSSLIAANVQYQLENTRLDDQNQVSGQDDNAPSVGTQSMVVSWVPPTKRVDNTTLGASELSGYEIYITSDNGGEGKTVVVDNPNATEHTIGNLGADTYHVALVAIDENGIYSDLSEIVTTTIISS